LPAVASARAQARAFGEHDVGVVQQPVDGGRREGLGRDRVDAGGVLVGRDGDRAAFVGGPLVVGTIAYAVVGATLFIRRHRAARRPSPQAVATATPADPPLPPPVTGDGGLIGVDTRRLARDQTWFLAIFVLKVGLGLVAFAIKPWLGLVFFAVYGLYFWREMRGEGEASAEDLEPLKLQRHRQVPARWAVLAQTALTLVVIFTASQLFVRQLEWGGPILGVSPVVVALLLSPVATELPEFMNALIWVRQGKTQLALVNISGAMTIQATIPSGLGLLFTPWLFDTPLLLAGIATMASVVYLLVLLRLGRLTAGRLIVAALFYSAFAVALGATA
jgi:cation:H+ antiporter